MNTSTHHEDYLETLKTKKEIADRMIRTKNHMLDLNGNIEKDDNFKKLTSKSLDALTKGEAFQIYENKGSEYKQANIEKKEIIEKHKVLKNDLVSKKFSGAKHVKNFLEKNNNEQRNKVAKFFKFKKDPLKITTLGAARLSDIANKEHKTHIKKADNNIEQKRSELKTATTVFAYAKLKDNLQKDQGLYALNNQRKQTLEKPLREMLHKVIDLDFKSLKEFIKENKVNVKTLLAYVKDFISDSLKLKSSKIEKNKLEKLSTNLEKIDNKLTQEKSQKEKTKIKIN